MARIRSFSAPEDWELAEKLRKMSSKEIRQAIEEGLKVIKRKGEKTPAGV